LEILIGLIDRNGLMNFVRIMAKKLLQTFIIHGEDDSSESLANALRTELVLGSMVTPNPLQTFDA
jgi:metallo-beta-lactamase family protein